MYITFSLSLNSCSTLAILCNSDANSHVPCSIPFATLEYAGAVVAILLFSGSRSASVSFNIPFFPGFRLALPFIAFTLVNSFFIAALIRPGSGT